MQTIWRRHMGLFITVFLALVLWSGTLRLDATPYGDGSRIMIWLSFLQGPADGFSAWMPFRNGGFPLFADPEQFWYLMPFVNVDSPFANLQLNLMLFFVIMLPVALVWVIGRRLGLDPVWAGFAAIFVAFNELSILNEQSARFAAFINISSLLFVLAIMLKPRLFIRDYVLLTVCVGISLAVSVQYALFHGLVIFSTLVMRRNDDTGLRFGQILLAGAKTGAICGAGLLLAMVILLPLVGHGNAAFAQSGALNYMPRLTDSFSDLMRFVIPFWPSAYPIFLSLLIVPAGIFSVVWGVPQALRHWGRDLVLPLGFVAVFLVMCLPLIGPWLANAYALLPVLSTVRQFLFAAGFITIVLPLAAAMIFHTYRHKQIDGLPWGVRLALGLFLMLSAGSALLFGTSTNFLPGSVLAGLSGVVLLAAALYFLWSGFLGVVLAGVERQSIATFGLGLAGVSLLLTAPQAFTDYHPVKQARKIHVTNTSKYPKIQKQILADTEPYFRVVSAVRVTHFLYAKTRMMGGFSTHMPASLAYTLSYLNPRHDISQQRPHWIRRLPCKKLDLGALDLVQSKYLLCRKQGLKTGLPSGFDKVGQEKGLHILRRTNPDGYAFRVYCRYKKQADLGPRGVRGQVLSSFAQRTLLLPQSAENWPEDKACPATGFAKAKTRVTADRPDLLRLRVISQHKGVLVVPGNFAPGWSATVNGKTVPIARAFFAYRGIPVGGGENLVQLAYQDPYFETGLKISFVTALILFFTWIISFFLPGSGTTRRTGRTDKPATFGP